MVFPENMRKLDTENSSESLKTLEDYISYMQERIDFSIGHLRAEYITVGQLGGTNGITISPEGITLGSDCKITWGAIEDKPTIPTKTSELQNNSGFINSQVATQITQNTVTTSYVNALGITATNLAANTVLANHITAEDLTITGGGIDMTTYDYQYKPIRLSYGGHENTIDGTQLNIEYSNARTTVTYDGIGMYKNSVLYAGITMNGTMGYQLLCDTINCSSACYLPTYTYVDNDIVATVSWVEANFMPINGSSRRIKHDIHPISEDLKNQFRGLYNIDVLNWTYNNDVLNKDNEYYGKEKYGIIAEDVERVLPGAVVHNKDGLTSNYNDRDILNAMLFLLQEQNERLKVLENGNN